MSAVKKVVSLALWLVFGVMATNQASNEHCPTQPIHADVVSDIIPYCVPFHWHQLRLISKVWNEVILNLVDWLDRISKGKLSEEWQIIKDGRSFHVIRTCANLRRPCKPPFGVTARVIGKPMDRSDIILIGDEPHFICKDWNVIHQPTPLKPLSIVKNLVSGEEFDLDSGDVHASFMLSETEVICVQFGKLAVKPFTTLKLCRLKAGRFQIAHEMQIDRNVFSVVPRKQGNEIWVILRTKDYYATMHVPSGNIHQRWPFHTLHLTPSLESRAGRFLIEMKPNKDQSSMVIRIIDALNGRQSTWIDTQMSSVERIWASPLDGFLLLMKLETKDVGLLNLSKKEYTVLTGLDSESLGMQWIDPETLALINDIHNYTIHHVSCPEVSFCWDSSSESDDEETLQVGSSFRIGLCDGSEYFKAGVTPIFEGFGMTQTYPARVEWDQIDLPSV